MDNSSSPFVPSGFGNNSKPVGKVSGFSSRFNAEPKATKQPGFFSALFGTGRAEKRGNAGNKKILHWSNG